MNIDTAKLQIAKELLFKYTEDNKLKTFNIIHLYPDYNTKLEDKIVIYINWLIFNIYIIQYYEL